MTSANPSPGVLSSPSSSNSSSLISQWSYDVFLNFRGEDTRDNFIGHLYSALHQKGINTYIDDKLKKGEEISPALLKAIEESKISIVIFSENYVSSTWCLDELIKILECKESKQHKVLQVFYKVEPSTVRHQKNSFKEGLAKHEDKFMDDAKVQRWKTALKQATDLSGLHLKINGNESEFIQKIVQELSSMLPNRTCLHVANYPVGLESRVKDINMLLCIEMINETRMIGIFGIGGIGKTTIAKQMYNLIADQFEGSCFLANVRENSKPDKGGLIQLQEKILSDIIRDPNFKVGHVDRGINLIKEKLRYKKILLVLDDIDCLDQLENLSGRCDWFGLGSRIIITTRDEHLLVKHDVGNWKYPMNKLDHEDAVKLFSWHAFKCDKPDNDFVELTKLALQYAGGLPLALTVVGSNLRGRDIDYWRSELEKYKRIPDKKIYEILKISFDGLNYYEKNIFLDIACFFKGEERKYIIQILHGCGSFPDSGIINLIDKSLIIVNECDKLTMHDLLEDMGKEIVREESPEEPGRRSRLWFYEDVRYVLEEKTGTKKIHGILIDMPPGDRMILSSPNVLAKMKKLRIFINRNASFGRGLNCLSNELRVLDWPECPWPSWPPKFLGKKLIALKMEGSMIGDFGMGLLSKNLTSIDLSYCENLTKISDLSSCSNLEKLILDECKSLVEVHDSVGFLDKLFQLGFKQCSNLKNLPKSFKLRSLKVLNLEGCTNLEYFPEINCEMEHLKCLWLESTVIQELPSSVTYLTRLKYLYLGWCKSLVRLPLSIFQLERLDIVDVIYCQRFVNFEKEVGHNGQSMPCTQENEISSSMEFLTLSPPKSNFNLRELVLSGSGIVSLPPCIEGFVGLSHLYLEDCMQLEEILHLPPNIEEVKANGCSSLKKFLSKSNNLLRDYNFSSSLRKLNLSGSGIVSLPLCIEEFVGLSHLYLEDCKQLEEILHLPPNILEVKANGCSNLKKFLPESNNLLRTYNFSSNLWKLNLSGSGIVSLPPCLEGFVGLSHLYLEDCKQLEEILHLPPNIQEVKANGCSCLKNFLPESNNLLRTYNFSSSLMQLNLSGSGIVSLPSCIKGFFRLCQLDLRDCKQLEEILHLPPNIEEVNANECFNLKKFFPESYNLLRTYNFSSNLWKLNLSGSGIVSIPPCIERFVGLSHLYLEDCKQLKEILHLPPNINEVNANGCSSLKKFFPESNNLLRTYNFSFSLRKLNLSGSGIVSLPPFIERFD
ncbi:disease resistance protein RPV1-like isoform X1 [Carya illinoinensis]|uniref:disease resistance protein RPV1-like isoform X1 n=2 Tax=Carya illinoinensis TaxID=32201 RepID=UPI001C727019|nr:disease resistance protein RPV1-like isoform X1 [Carya illinoinensis]